MKRIYKYEVQPNVYTMMPPDAQVLSVGEQMGRVFCWALVNSDAVATAKRRIFVAGTGHECPDDAGRFIGTVLMTNGLVFHFFDYGEDPPYRSADPTSEP